MLHSHVVVMEYDNREAVRGTVDVSVPEDFVDLSTVHRPLYSEVKVHDRTSIYSYTLYFASIRVLHGV